MGLLTQVSPSKADCSAPFADLQRFGELDPTAKSGYSIPTTRQALITSFMGLGALVRWIFDWRGVDTKLTGLQFGSLIAGKIKSGVGTKKATIISCVKMCCFVHCLLRSDTRLATGSSSS